MNKEDFIIKRTRIIGDMLDNPDKYDIYPTTKCFSELDNLFDEITNNICKDCGYFELKHPIIEEIKNERKRQDSLWGIQNHIPLKWLAILGEEVGEANKEVLEALNIELLDNSTNEYEKYRTELIHVAAVAIQAIESLDRRNKKLLKGK
jgi:hypothetical protein